MSERTQPFIVVVLICKSTVT